MLVQHVHCLYKQCIQCICLNMHDTTCTSDIQARNACKNKYTTYIGCTCMCKPCMHVALLCMYITCTLCTKLLPNVEPLYMMYKACTQSTCFVHHVRGFYKLIHCPTLVKMYKFSPFGYRYVPVPGGKPAGTGTLRLAGTCRYTC
jgi:hypothetical protein